MISILVSSAMWSVPALSVPLTMSQIYNYAKNGNIKALKSLGKQVDSVGRDGNTNLCRSIYNNDYKAFNTLRVVGANVRHPCIQKIPPERIKTFDKGYTTWAKRINSAKNAATMSSITSKRATAPISTETGLSTTAMVGVGVAAATLIGGGIALAAGGGGGGGSGSGSKDPCAGVICDDENAYCEAGSCMCKEGWGLHSSNRCWKDMVCPPHSTQYQDNCICDQGYDYYGAAECHATLGCVHGEQMASSCSCQTGWIGSICSEAAPCTGHELMSCPTNATSCSPCQSGDTIKYKVDGCKEGWTGTSCSTAATCPYNTTSCGQGYHATGKTCKSGNTTYTECTMNTCTGSTTNITHCSNQETSCWSGSTPYYTCKACSNGWTLSNNACTANACTGHELTSCPANATSCSPCQSGDTIKYKVDGCKEGWTGTSCSTAATCPYNTTSCGQGYHETGKTCKSGNTTYKECVVNDCSGYKTTCAAGYHKKSETPACISGTTPYYECVANTCSGGSTSTVNNCKSETTCQSGSTVYHTCTTCNDGYELVNNTCNLISNCPANTYGIGNSCYSCPAHSSSPAHSQTIDKCICHTGYTRIGNLCLKSDTVSNSRAATVGDFTANSSYTNTKTLAPINAAQAYAKFIRINSDGTYNYSALENVNVLVDDTVGEENRTGSGDINYASEEGERDYLTSSLDDVTNTSNHDNPGHGMSVAGVIAAKWNYKKSIDYIGIAPNAYIYTLYMGLSHSKRLTLLEEAIDKNVRVWNMSYGDDTPVGKGFDDLLEYLETNNTEKKILDEHKIGLKSGVIMVHSAGNSGYTNPHDLDVMGAYSWEEGGKTYSFKNAYVVAMNVKFDDKKEKYNRVSSSNRCGWAAGYCIAAPSGTKTRWHTSGFTGTSNSAPVVSGSIAFLMGAYPYVPSKQIVEILFRTANKNNLHDWSGTAGTWTDSFGNSYDLDSTYGHGMVDLGAATEPLGVISIPTSTTMATTMGDLNAITKSPVAETKLALPRVLNRNISVSLPETVMGLDDYNRPFAVKTKGLITRAHRTDETFRRYFKSFMNRDRRTFSGVPDKMSFEFTSSITNDNLLGMGVLDINYRFDDKAALKFSYRSDILDEERHFDRALANPFLNMKNSYGLMQEFNLNKKLTFKFETVFGKNGFYRGDEDLDEEYNRSAHAFMTGADYKINHALTLKVIGGILSEKDAVLGINGKGALNTDTSKTYFTGSILEYSPLPKLSLSAAYYYGQTQVPHSDSLVSFSDMLSDGFAFDARYHLDNKKMFGFQFSSPLRIRKGIASLNIPIARDMHSDTVYYDSMDIDLKPNAREYDIGIYYTQESDNFDWRGEFMTRFHPDHISGIKPDYRALFGLSLKY